jgi:hypothetical protein
MILVVLIVIAVRDRLGHKVRCHRSDVFGSWALTALAPEPFLGGSCGCQAALLRPSTNATRSASR